MELNDLPQHYNFPCVMRPVTVAGVPKPRIVRLHGRWFVRSAPYVRGENPATLWDYWDLATLAAQWCHRMNERDAWEQWGGRNNRGD